jgi:hypothetical protein
MTHPTIKLLEEAQPLFIPLQTKYFEAFADGSKADELRAYGPRWNENTCYVGRPVTLSKGYGKKHRLYGVVTGFKKQHGSVFGSHYRAAITDVYGTLDKWIACITIGDIRADTIINEIARRIEDGENNF